MKKLVLVAAVIVMAGSAISCGQKTQKVDETVATEPVVEQVEAVAVETVTPATTEAAVEVAPAQEVK